MKTALKAFEQELNAIREAGTWREERIITTPQRACIDTTQKSHVVNMCANNYLGLSDDPRLIEAAKASYDRWGFGLSSVRFICGTQEIHKELERRIAKFAGTDDAILYSSCFDANGGLFETLLGPEDAVISDELNHASIIDGVRISYCPTAVLYDEQPITFRDSWNQRFRWAKGFYQVFAHYAGGLVKGTLTNPRGYRFACYDMLMTIAPGMLLSIISILFNTIIIVLAATGVMSTGVAIASSVTSVVFCLCNYIVFMFVFGVLTTFVEWDSIRTTTAKKIRYMFTFPFFMLTYIPIALIALVKKAAWKPIRHSISVDVAEFSEAEGVRLSSK